MHNFMLLLGIMAIGAMAWWIDSMIPHWFKKDESIPLSPKISDEKNEVDPRAGEPSGPSKGNLENQK